MNDQVASREEQAGLWNGEAGRAWVDAQDLIDKVFAPLKTIVVDTAVESGATAILDIGCGTGATTRAMAEHIEGARCTGIDISAPMVAAARTLAQWEGSPASFIEADAETHRFAAESMELLVSRFGVMFFADPVAAFNNLRRASTADGALRLIVWRSARDNPFMTTAERAAAPLLPSLPPRAAVGPGQFSLGDKARLAAILRESGWRDVDIEPFDEACSFKRQWLTQYISNMGPVGRILRGADDDLRARVVEAVMPAFMAYVRGDDVVFDAACWLVSARAGRGAQ